MATLREIQLTELTVLKEIDRICKENGIKYSLGYGTFLGAVRHKGFIPWDDDTDIYMSYAEFKKFEKAFSSTECFLQTEKTDPTCPYIMYKVRKNNTVMKEKGLEALGMHQGIWVDIFVYVNAAKRQAFRKLQFNMTKVIRTFRCRTLAKINHRENILQKIANHMPLKVNLAFDKMLVDITRLLGNKRSGDSLILINGRYKSMFKKTEYFENLSDYLFEDAYFPGPADYDGYLQCCYGKEYMTPKRYDSHILSYDDVIC